MVSFHSNFNVDGSCSRQYSKEVESPVSKSTFVKTAQDLKLSVDDLIRV
jgi:hypothetical protein